MAFCFTLIGLTPNAFDSGSQRRALLQIHGLHDNEQNDSRIYKTFEGGELVVDKMDAEITGGLNNFNIFLEQVCNRSLLIRE